jgi:hypothetical protein
MFQSHGQDAWSVTGLRSRLSRRKLRPPGIAAGLAPGGALAAALLSKPIRFMAGATPGGSIDPLARARSVPVVDGRSQRGNALTFHLQRVANV